MEDGNTLIGWLSEAWTKLWSKLGKNGRISSATLNEEIKRLWSYITGSPKHDSQLCSAAGTGRRYLSKKPQLVSRAWTLQRVRWWPTSMVQDNDRKRYFEWGSLIAVGMRVSKWQRWDFSAQPARCKIDVTLVKGVRVRAAAKGAWYSGILEKRNGICMTEVSQKDSKWWSPTT